MTVCKFFQQGYCRYGQNCRFEHIYAPKYSYHATPPQAPQTTSTTTKPETDEQLVNQVLTDVKSVLHGGQWILSCYAPYKEKPLMPGLHDLSPEEMRLFVYEAKANNNLEQAILYLNNLTKEARQKYELLLHPTPALIKILRSIFHYKPGHTILSPFTTNEPNAAGSVFRSAVQGFSPNATPSVFAQNPPNPDPKDIFSQASTSIFSQNNAQTPETAAKSIFAQANQNTFTNQNVFSTPQNVQSPSNIFATANQSLFSQNEPQSFQNNAFQPQPSPFSNTPQVDQSDFYSKMEDLSLEDVEAFKSDSFQLGFVPEVPPPQGLCT